MRRARQPSPARGAAIRRAARAATMALPLLGWLAGPLPARAEAWTNLAGQVLQADFLDYAAGVVALARPDGTILRLPLTALCEPDQRRVRRRAGEPLVPEFVRAAHRDAAALLQRFAQLPAERRTPEERARVAHMAQALFDARLAAGGAEALDAEAQSDIRRLRDSLR